MSWLERLLGWLGRPDEPRPRRGESAVASPVGPVPTFTGPLTEDSRHTGPGVYYLYLAGETAPVYIGKSKNVRHRLRWHRYHLQQGDYPENPPIEQLRWAIVPMATEPEAW